MIRVLNCSKHEDLQALRHEIIARAGHEVVSPRPTDALSKIGNEQFDVLVICYQIETEVADSLCTMFRQANPEGRIVAIVGVPCRRECVADVDVDAHSPSALVLAVSSYPATRSKFRHQRRLIFINSEEWRGWTCERCCWNRRQPEERLDKFSETKILQEFEAHSCEAFARDTWLTMVRPSAEALDKWRTEVNTVLTAFRVPFEEWNAQWPFDFADAFQRGNSPSDAATAANRFWSWEQNKSLDRQCIRMANCWLQRDHLGTCQPI